MLTFSSSNQLPDLLERSYFKRSVHQGFKRRAHVVRRAGTASSRTRNNPPSVLPVCARYPGNLPGFPAFSGITVLGGKGPPLVPGEQARRVQRWAEETPTQQSGSGVLRRGPERDSQATHFPAPVPHSIQEGTPLVPPPKPKHTLIWPLLTPAVPLPIGLLPGPGQGRQHLWSPPAHTSLLRPVQTVCTALASTPSFCCHGPSASQDP